jgi:uncharacterized membrane protein HdeD (DUF308 family)
VAGTRWRGPDEPEPFVGWWPVVPPLLGIVLGLVLVFLGPLAGLGALLVVGGVAGLPVAVMIVISGRGESPWR